MKNGAKKIIAISLGICVLALCNVFLFFVSKPYTEEIIIWLPDNYTLDNVVQNEVVSIMPNTDTGHQSDKVLYSQIDLDSFKKLFGKSRMVAIKIQDASYPGNEWYRIVYQEELDCADKNFIITAREYHRYVKRNLSEVKLRDGKLFLENKRDIFLICVFSPLSFIVVGFVVFLYILILKDEV